VANKIGHKVRLPEALAAETETYGMKPPSRVSLAYTTLKETLKTYVSRSRSKSPGLSSLALNMPCSISRLSFGEISVAH